MSYEQIARQVKEQANKQAKTVYEDYKKLKGFKDVGYLLAYYVVSGGEVVKNSLRNDAIDAAEIVVSLDNNILSRDGHTFTVSVPNTTYYLDFSKEGDWHWGLTHNGVAGVDYLPVASVTTNSSGLVSTIIDRRGRVGGTRFKDEYGLDDYAKQQYVDAQLADIAINVKKPPPPLVGAKGDGITDDTAAIKAAFDLAQAINGSVYFPYSALGYRTDAWNITGNIKIDGAPLTNIIFTQTSGTAITLKRGQFQISNLRCIGNSSVVFMKLNGSNDAAEAVVDSHFFNLRSEGFANSLTTSYCWDIKFDSCRFHNTTKIGTFGNQSNDILFSSCRFSTYINGSDFTNCETISFQNCDFVGYVTNPANNLVNNLYQSNVFYRDCYFEHINNLGPFGTFNEVGNSILIVNGGIFTGTNKVIKISVESRVGGTIKVENIVCDGVTLYKRAGVSHIGVLTNSRIEKANYNLLTKYDGDVAIDTVFSKVFGGTALVTTVVNGYARINPGAWNGIVLRNGMDLNKNYTVVICYRSNNDGWAVNQDSGTLTPLKATNGVFKTITLTFQPISPRIILYDNNANGGDLIDIAFIRVFEGVAVNDFSYLTNDKNLT